MADRKKLLKEWFFSDVNKELEIKALRSKIRELEERLREKLKTLTSPGGNRGLLFLMELGYNLV